MNKYIKDYYKKHKKALKNSEQDIKSYKGFYNYLKAQLLSNIEYDFGENDFDFEKMLEKNNK